MAQAAPYILIAAGALNIIIRGILGKGIGFGRGKFIVDKLGSGAARIINIVTGLIIVTLGVLMLVYPEWFGLDK